MRQTNYQIEFYNLYMRAYTLSLTINKADDYLKNGDKIVLSIDNPKNLNIENIDDFPTNYDWGIISGVFNNKREDSIKFYQSVIKTMYLNSNKGVMFMKVGLLGENVYTSII